MPHLERSIPVRCLTMSRQRRDVEAVGVCIPSRRGVELLHDPVRNKGTAFTDSEREALGLRGLLPPRVQSQSQQVSRVLDVPLKLQHLVRAVHMTLRCSTGSSTLHAPPV